MRTVIFTIFLLFATGVPFAARAAVIPDTACDVDFMDIVEARAWMEGKRELEAAQLLILKPDSVLEYSCFDNQLDALSNSNPWSNANGNMSSVLSELPRPAANTFVSSNFGSPGGGTYSGSYNCGAMSVVFDLWEAIKCSNADDVASFQTFQELENSDFRTLPNACDSSDRANKWNAAIAVTNPAPASPAASGGMEAMNLFLPLLSNASAACSTITPIPTGVITGGGAPHPDAVCSIPGCYYDGAGSCQ